MKNVLIIGADGFVGQTVFEFLSDKYQHNIFATTRSKKNNSFYLSVGSYLKDLKIILLHLKKIDFIINCIGKTNAKTDNNDLNFINGNFPHLLESYTSRIGAKLIHISSDAVFSKTSGLVNESSVPNPDTEYGVSKLKGETKSKNSITIRTSFLGLDPIKHRGFIEQIKESTGVLKVSNKELWSGCTTLQFAEFCNDIIFNDLFDKLRNKTRILHFTPLKGKSKYELALIVIKKFNLREVTLKEASASHINRILDTKYKKIVKIKKYASSPNTAILNLIKYYEKN